jgi:hypothetical protein
MGHSQDDVRPGGEETRFPAVVLIGFLTIAVFYLITEHRAHLLGWLPWVLLLACPLLHVFMHGGHGQSGDAGGSSFDGRQSNPPHPALMPSKPLEPDHE